ncbi:MAG: hypothetical protein U1A78_26695 [Polyangia bacterium]
MSHTASDLVNCAPRPSPIAWWIAWLQARTAAGDDPLFVLAGLNGFWGLWVSVRQQWPSLAGLGQVVDEGLRVPRWLRRRLAFGVAPRGLDPFWSVECLAALLRADKTDFRPGRPFGFLCGPVRGDVQTAPAAEAIPEGSAEHRLALWQEFHDAHKGEDPRLVLAFRCGTWRLWASLGDARGLKEILPVIGCPVAELGPLPSCSANTRLIGGFYDERAQLGPDELLERALFARSVAQPWVYLMHPREDLATAERPF